MPFLKKEFNSIQIHFAVTQLNPDGVVLRYRRLDKHTGPVFRGPAEHVRTLVHRQHLLPGYYYVTVSRWCLLGLLIDRYTIDKKELI